MKYFTTFLLVFSTSYSAWSQKPSIEKIWIAKDYTFLKLHKNMATLYTIDYPIVKQLTYKFSGDTLFLKEENTIYTFLASVTFGTLELKALGLPDNRLFRQTSINLLDRTHIYSDISNFKILRYNYQGSGYEIRNFSMEIYEGGKVRFINHKFASEAEYSEGKLSPQQYKDFLKHLRNTAIDQIAVDTKCYYHHAPKQTLQINYNGTLKFFRQHCYPPFTIELFGFLSNLPNMVMLRPTKAFDIFLTFPNETHEAFIERMKRTESIIFN